MPRLTKKYSLSAVAAEAKLKNPAIEIDLGKVDGKQVSVIVDPPQLWPDEVAELSREGQLTEVTKLLLGDQFDTWRAGGGTNALLQQVIREHTQATMGESSAS